VVTTAHDGTARVWDSSPIAREFRPKEPAPRPAGGPRP
jgi:hypothetical protein